jgi:membrane fusion protein (multidrug efflux system)
VDAIPGRTFAGKVEDLSPATEGEFGAVPPDPSAGNFTKYVQRVPVKIAFDRLSPEDNDKVRIGLSANVSLRRQKWAAK